jgi:hypothetical protein
MLLRVNETLTQLAIPFKRRNGGRIPSLLQMRSSESLGEGNCHGCSAQLERHHQSHLGLILNQLVLRLQSRMFQLPLKMDRLRNPHTQTRHGGGLFHSAGPKILPLNWELAGSTLSAPFLYAQIHTSAS